MAKKSITINILLAILLIAIGIGIGIGINGIHSKLAVGLNVNKLGLVHGLRGVEVRAVGLGDLNTAANVLNTQARLDVADLRVSRLNDLSLGKGVLSSVKLGGVGLQVRRLLQLNLTNRVSVLDRLGKADVGLVARLTDLSKELDLGRLQLDLRGLDSVASSVVLEGGLAV